MQKLHRPGYFGRKRDTIVASYNKQYGEGNWGLRWYVGDEAFDFKRACIMLYQESYLRYFVNRPHEVDQICQYTECIDNADTNVKSGLDYMSQEAFSTHIQDIAVRNCLSILGRVFEGTNGRVLTIRSKDSEGYRWGPGNIPFLYPQAIKKHIISLRPSWAHTGSVEHFWQEEKYIVLFEEKDKCSNTQITSH